MKILFYLYLLALGVFGDLNSAYSRDWWYEFNATEHTKQTIFFDDDLLSGYPYVSLYMSIYEEYQNSSYFGAGYESLLTFTSPNISDYYLGLCSGCNFIVSYFSIGPCGFPNLISNRHGLNISHVQKVKNYMSLLQIQVKTTIELENTLINDLPASSEIVCDGIKRYRTVKIIPWDTHYYENKDLLITLSTPFGTDVSDYILQVIFLTEDQCNNNWTDIFPDYSEACFNIYIPLNNGSSHTLTVPAKEIWYIVFVTSNTFNPDTISNVDFMVVDRPYSPAFIPSLNLSVIVLLILSLFVYRQ